jgi:hypothetical protein
MEPKTQPRKSSNNNLTLLRVEFETCRQERQRLEDKIMEFDRVLRGHNGEGGLIHKVKNIDEHFKDMKRMGYAVTTALLINFVVMLFNIVR